MRLMSSIADLHVLIELSPESLKSTIVDFTTLNPKNYFNTLQSIIAEEDLKRMEKYIDNVSSISYIYYPSKSIIGLNNWKSLKSFLAFLYTNSFDLLHFDTISARLLPLLPFISNKKIIATIHDPVPHIGEKSRKRSIINWLYSMVINEYVFYSIYARNQFVSSRPALHNKTAILKLLPYSYINNFKQATSKSEQYILYFGRISAYKGLDLLINAADYILHRYPSIKIYIAGKSHGDYKLDLAGKGNIQYINSYLSINQLAELIQHALFVVCPYKEATQSGVLMTSLAMNKPVLATSVGAFNEYIKNGENGILVEPSVDGIQRGITQMLTGKYYLDLTNNIDNQSNEVQRQYNYERYKQLYSHQK